MTSRHSCHKLSYILVIIGGLNIFIIGLFDVDIIMKLFGSALGRIIFIVIGLAAVYELFSHKRVCEECGKKGSDDQASSGHHTEGKESSPQNQEEREDVSSDSSYKM